MKVPPRVFTAKSSEPQTISSDAMGDGSGVAKIFEINEKKFDEAEWEIRLQNKPRQINQKPVER